MVNQPWEKFVFIAVSVVKCIISWYFVAVSFYYRNVLKKAIQTQQQKR